MSDGIVGQENLTIPDLIEPVIAFRSWDHDDGKLIGPYWKTPWERRMEAAHRGYAGAVGDKDKDCAAPAEGCHCGLYGYFELDDGEFPSSSYHGAIRGAISVWGRLAVHETGIRAQHAEIVCLVEDQKAISYMAALRDWETGRSALRKLASAYEVPVVEPERLVSFAYEFGSPLPDSILARVRELNVEHDRVREERKRQFEAASQRRRKELAQKEAQELKVRKRSGGLLPKIWAGQFFWR